MSQSASFQSYNYSPVIPKGSLGVSIYMHNQMPNDSVDGSQLYGAFRVPEEYVNDIKGKPHKAIILVATSGDYVFANDIFSDSIIFEDDLICENGVVQGYFNILVFDYIKGGKGRFNIMVSLGPYMSNSEISFI